ncbi:MAG: MFS transporter [Caulobacteraceae bacterium]
MSESQFAAIDEQKFHRFHVRALLVTGLGVFCDGYDISAIGLVLPQALAAYGIHKVGAEGGVLSAVALVGSMLGALVFGLLAQKGRKRFYGLDALILGVAALAQAFMPTFWALVACRFVLGIGVGGDYVLSPTIMAEHANRADRGKAIGLGFGTMWPIGALAAAVLKLLLDSFHTPPELVWKIVLAAGAVPALGVMYFRRRMPESARFLAKLADDKRTAMAVMQEVGAVQTTAPEADSRPFGQVFALHARHIFAAALLWMVYDLVVYASILFGPNLIAGNLHIPASIFQIENELIFIIPASVLGSWLMIDQWGRKPLQVWGFIAGAVVLAIFAILRSQFANLALLAFLVFGLFNIALTGPGLVSGAGIFGVELAPTRIRSVAQSITVVGGRIGAAISGFVFPIVHDRIGFAATMWGLAGLSLLGGVLSQVLVPETGSRSLEEINLEFQPATKAAA